METLRDLDLVRAVSVSGVRHPTELRAKDDGTMPTLVVRFSPFDVWYEIESYWEGNFMERTLRGAFSKTMKEQRQNVKILYDHGHDYHIGNKVLAPTDDLREDADAAVAEGGLFDTSYNRDLLPGLEAGVYGSSFRFRVIKEEWNDDPGVSDHNPKGIPERTITEVRLFEAGPVTFPANPDATAGVRSLTDSFYEKVKSTNPTKYDEMLARTMELRTPKVEAAADSTADLDGAAPDSTDEPAERHSHGYTPAQRRAILYPFLRKETQ